MAAMPRGGKRPNAGRPKTHPSGENLQRVTLFLTKDEAQKVKEFVLWMREQASDPEGSELLENFTAFFKGL
jgi:hypothetical protein